MAQEGLPFRALSRWHIIPYKKKEKKIPHLANTKNNLLKISKKNIPSSGLKYPYTINILKLVHF